MFGWTPPNNKPSKAMTREDVEREVENAARDFIRFCNERDRDPKSTLREILDPLASIYGRLK